MSVRIAVSGAAAEAVERLVPQLVSDLVASRLTGGDASLWGADAEDESSKRLGWVQAVSVSRPLIPEIYELRDALRSAGVNHIVLGGMGGSSLAPEVITSTYGVELTVLDSTDPGQVMAALHDRLATTAVVISSKSGSTLETDSQKRIYEQFFTDAGIDPLQRIVIVTDPGSPLDGAAREAGYRVFNADPTVGGRYSALTAFGLVPSGLAGVDLDELLDESEAVMLELAVDHPDNPGLVLAAAIAGTVPLKDKLGIVTDGTHIRGFGDWAEQLIAESTGKLGKGILPVVLDVDSPELSAGLADLQVVRLVGDWDDTKEVADGEIEIAGSLGAQILVWEYATAIAGRLLGINPFDQPDVESAKIATRALIDNPSSPAAPAFVVGDIEVRGTSAVVDGVSDLSGAIDKLVESLPSDGYVAIQAYVDRVAYPELVTLRDAIAKRSGRPVTFGWGPRFLHSTGQFHKGGPAVGVFLQITSAEQADLQIPDRPFTFGQLIRAQADGDASVLADHGRPVLSLTLASPAESLPVIISALG
ncbi:glucose-6-phosphate isomerase [Salinibacterium sp. CAN_S4]|uniref:glucose-6-phosphate isomerase n=1 Tax=Salinibacterium sp. CAN_S4 TaxID=2787727 RepID=UPI0018EFB2D0